jgi:acetate kinase
MKILVLNSGSSSQKACLYEIGDSLPQHPPVPLWEGRIEWNGDTVSTSIKTWNGAVKKEERKVSSHRLVLKDLLRTCWTGETRTIDSSKEIGAVGHRLVHGGHRFQQPVRVSSDVYAALNDLSRFAPLHIHSELAGIDVVLDLLGKVSQYAVFDTAFHRKMPGVAQTYPGPYEWFENGIQRYGFHGINHEYCAARSAQMLAKDVKALKQITCHLGNGCSITAIDAGRSVDTTMGFTPLDGLMMGTRSGSIDPGILTFLMRQQGLNADQLDEVLNKRSGLLGISGVSGDMRDVLAAISEGNTRARLAFDLSSEAWLPSLEA